MVGDTSNRPRLAGIKPAPLCREEGRRSRNMKASNLPSLVRLGMFKSANDAKSRFIQTHMKTAAALAQAPSAEGAIDPRHWGGPPDFPRSKVSEPLAVMATEAALEEYRQRQRLERKRGHSSHGRECVGNAPQHQRSGASASTAMRRARLQRIHPHGRLRQNKSLDRLNSAPGPHKHNHHQRQPRAHPQTHHHTHHKEQSHHKQQNRPPSTHAVILPQGGGLVLIGEDGVRKSKFPRGCEHAAETRKITTPVHSSVAGEDDVLARLCDPKHFTGTAATGQLPTVVDLEGGVGVLLKGDSAAVKDHIGAQEVSWRLRLAERL